MEEKSISFGDPMARAILAGTKTQTRRTTGLEHINEEPDYWFRAERCEAGREFRFTGGDRDKVLTWGESYVTPRYQIGDRVRTARIWLEITDVRAERLQQISEVDAKAEGVEPENAECGCPGGPYRNAFCWLWDSLYEQRAGLSWDDNPYVFVYGFRLIAQ
ncbi:MAG: ASCH domain-containing protein [Planctomycetota bacterium]|nr:ASCH domain-containing protein [Planctomycetota bacterium]